MTDRENSKETPALSKIYQNALEFNDRYGLAYYGKPRALRNGMARMRIKMIREECKEYIESQEAAREQCTLLPEDFDPDLYRHELERALDGLVDIVYATVVTAAQHGFDFDRAWDRVHKANMQKVRGDLSSDAERGGAYDIVKPEGWQSPDLSDLVKDNDLC